MNSTVLALANRTLNSSAKHLGWHLGIVGLAGLNLLVLLRVCLIEQSLTAPGLEFVRWSVELNLFATTLAGIGLFATRITAEREAGTLDLLRLAGLGSAGIISARWLPLLVTCSMLLIVQIPFAMLAVALGGVTPSQVIAVYVVMCLHLIFVASISLWVSIHCRTSGGAVVLAALILAIWCFGAKSFQPILATIGGYSQSISSLTRTISEFLDSYPSISGFGRVSQALSFGNSTPIWWDWPELLQSGLAVVMILWAWASLEFQASKETRTWSRKTFRSTRRRPLWKNAIAWKEFMFLTGGWRGMAIRVVVYPLVGIIFSDGWKLERMYDPAIRTLGWDGAILLAQVFSREFRDETWDTLRLIPLTLGQLCYRKLSGVALALFPGVLWVEITRHYWHFGVEGFERLEHAFICTIVLLGWHITTVVSVWFFRTTWGIAFLAGLVSATTLFQFVSLAISRSRFRQHPLILYTLLDLVACIVVFQLVRMRIRSLSK